MSFLSRMKNIASQMIFGKPQAEDEILKIPSLGRHVELGMFYDRGSDTLIENPYLPSEGKGMTVPTQGQLASNAELITGDRYDQRFKSLEFEPGLELSYLAGLVKPSGSSTYIDDHVRSSHQTRAVMKYKKTGKSEKLNLRSMVDLFDVGLLEKGDATHLVSGILYGIQAFLVIDNILPDQDSDSRTREELEHLLQRLLSNQDEEMTVSDEDKAILEKLQFHVHSDCQPPSYPSTSLATVRYFRRLVDPQNSSDETCVPLMIWLHPISVLDDNITTPMHEVSKSLTFRIERYIECFDDVDLKCNELLVSTASQSLAGIKQFVTQCTEVLMKYREVFRSQLRRIVPKIRSGEVSEDFLLECLDGHEMSPFSFALVMHWLQLITDQISVIGACIRAIPSLKIAQSTDDLFAVERFCLCFNIQLNNKSSYLLTMQDYLNSISDDDCQNLSKPTKKLASCLPDVSRGSLDKNAQYFFDFAEANQNNLAVSLFIAEGQTEMDKPGGSVHLYREGILANTDYHLPSKPGEPRILQETHDSITVEWDQPEWGWENITGYTIRYKIIESEEWIGEKRTRDSVNSITVGNLEAARTYQFCVYGNFEFGSSPLSEMSELLETLSSSPPGQPKLVSATHDSLTVKWKTPDLGAENVIGYIVRYTRVPDIEWSNVFTDGPEDHFTVENLAAAATYIVQLCARYEKGTSDYSLVSEELSTYPIGPPGKPTVEGLSALRAQVSWSCPDIVGTDYEIDSFQVFVTENTSPGSYRWKKRFTTRSGDVTEAKVRLQPNTEYRLSVSAKCGSIYSPKSEPSNLIILDATEADILRCRVLDQSRKQKRPVNPGVYLVKSRTHSTDLVRKVRKITFGEPNLGIPEKVVLIVGATGVGKTTFINGILNYVLGVKWEDDHRFKLVNEKVQGTQAKSQTTWITAYTLNHQPGVEIPFNLTIIDTPGFGDTSGIQRDKQIAEQLKEFFSTRGEDRIDHIDAVGFVVQSPHSRLTHTQRYIFDSILALFGRDIAENIFLLITFADGQEPPVLAGVQEAKLPYQKYFKFNNSALFSKNSFEKEGENDPQQENENTCFNEMFWKMGMISYEKFMTELYHVSGKSLTMTNNVMYEREQIETFVSGIHRDIQTGLNTLERLRVEIALLRDHEKDIDRNKNFTYTVREEKSVKVDIPKGRYTTNCVTCNVTCHFPCAFSNDKDKVRCAAMKDGSCKICPKRCRWDMHHNLPYRFIVESRNVEKTSNNLKSHYESAMGKSLTAKQIISKVMKDFSSLQSKILWMSNEIRKCLNRLNEIALKPDPLTQVGYIDVLIESEKFRCSPGWAERVSQLMEVRKQADELSRMCKDDFDPFEKYAQMVEEAREKSGVKDMFRKAGNFLKGLISR